MENFKHWVSSSLIPWKDKNKKEQEAFFLYEEKLKRSERELKYLIALLLDGQTSDAVSLWNALDLEPSLLNAEINIKKDELTLTTQENKDVVLSVKETLTEVQQIFS